MARSALKTKISELLGVDRTTIEFVQYEEEDEAFGITVNGRSLLMLTGTENQWCCGVLDTGATDNSISLARLSEQDRNSLCVDLFNQVYKMLATKVGQEELRKGLATWSHTSNNVFAQALKSEFNTDNMPWKLVEEFRNPNSGNTVCYFKARLVD